jgi:UDP-glucose 4-epimerase
MRDLITGGAGFIGSHLADRLVASGSEVLMLDDLSTGRRRNVEHLLDGVASNGHGPPRVELVEGSTCDADLVDGMMGCVDRCFHLASAVGVELVVDRPLDSLLRNARGSDNVFASAARHGVRLLFTSTSEIYGKNSNGALLEDSDRLLGPTQTARWGYANTKAFGEMLAFGYHRERGAETIVARLFNTVGPRQLGAYGMVVPRLVAQALAGDVLTVYGDGTQSRCFAHVGDTVEALALLAEHDGAVGNAYNVGSPTEVTILELAHKIIARTGSDSKVALVPYGEAYSEGFEELGRRKPDIATIERLTGWRPRRTLEQVLDDVIDYQRRTVAPDALGAGALTA